jgi:hypothetical protein
MSSTAAEILRELMAKALQDPEVQHAAHRIATSGVDYARKISPVGDDPKREHHPGAGGDFKASWSVVDLPPEHDEPPGAQIRNDDPGAVSIEYGTHDTPPHHTLASTSTYLESQFGVKATTHWTAPNDR